MTKSGGLRGGRTKGDACNTGRQASRSREAQTAAEGALFVQDSPVAPKEAPFTPDTTGMYPRPDSHANWPSTGAPQPRPEERRAQAQLQEAEEYFKDAEEVLGAATHVANQALQWGQCAASDCGCGQKPVSQSKLLDHMATYKPAGWLEQKPGSTKRPRAHGDADVQRQLKAKLNQVEWTQRLAVCAHQKRRQQLQRAEEELAGSKKKLAEVNGALGGLRAAFQAMQARTAELEKGKAGGGGKHTDLTHSLAFSDYTNQAKKRTVSKAVNGLVRALVTAQALAIAYRRLASLTSLGSAHCTCMTPHITSDPTAMCQNWIVW